MTNEYPKFHVAKGQLWTTLPGHMEQQEQVKASKSSEFLLGRERAGKLAFLRTPAMKLCIEHKEKETKFEFADHVQ